MRKIPTVFLCIYSISCFGCISTQPKKVIDNKNELSSSWAESYKKNHGLSDEEFERKKKEADLAAQQRLLEMQTEIIIAKPAQQIHTPELVNETPYVFLQNDETSYFRIYYTSPTIYLLKNESYSALDLIIVTYENNPHLVKDRYYYDINFPDGSYFSVNGEAVKYSISSSGNIEISDIGGHKQYMFLRPGKNDITITIGTKSVVISFDTIQLPFAKNESVDKVIEAIGLPTNRKSVYTEWPHTQSIDNIYYNPSAVESKISAKHWTFLKYPYFVVSIVGNKIYGYSSYCEFNDWRK